MARKIIGIKVYYLRKIFLHYKIHFKIKSIIYCIRVYSRTSEESGTLWWQSVCPL